RLRKLTAEMSVTGVAVGHLCFGFVSRGDRVAVFTYHQIFNRFSRKVKRRRNKGGGVSIQNFEALTRGDFVVHEDYGVGKFIGVKRIEARSPTGEVHKVDCILL